MAASEPLLHRRFPALRGRLDRIPLCELPTPVRRMDALSEALGGGTEVWLKDDSLIARPWGGNKPRKLEWALADACRRGSRTILTFGGLGTNHGLATTLYARPLGIRCVLALVDQPLDDEVRAQLERIRDAGARVHLTHGAARTVAALPYLMLRHAQPWPPRFPYWLPPGGSSPVGCVGFVEAGLELAEQVRSGGLPEPSVVVVALGSGGTAAGLLLGLRLAGLRSRIVAVRVSDQLRLSPATVLRLARRTRRLLVRRGAAVPEGLLSKLDVQVPQEWIGGGYGHRTPEAEEAVALARRTEGLSLEHVYTGKALAAMAALVRAGTLPPGPVLYWNTHSASHV